MKLQVITNNVGGLYTEEKLKEESYARSTEAGASNWVCVWVGFCICLVFVLVFVIYRDLRVVTPSSEGGFKFIF